MTKIFTKVNDAMTEMRKTFERTHPGLVLIIGTYMAEHEPADPNQLFQSYSFNFTPSKLMHHQQALWHWAQNMGYAFPLPGAAQGNPPTTPPPAPTDPDWFSKQ